MDFFEIRNQIVKKRSYLCIGLDPEPNLLPRPLRFDPDGIFKFCQAIIEATHDLAIAYKPNLAFFEVLGPKGMEVFWRLTDLYPPDIFKIADAKRGDIPNSARLYAETFYNVYGYDAVTVSPYMGKDCIKAFLQHPGKWPIITALTSNKGAEDFQLFGTRVPKVEFYRTVIAKTCFLGEEDKIMFVAGANHHELFVNFRRLAPYHFLLVPGVGAQGGDLAAVSRAGLTNYGSLIVNATRSIIYASNGSDFAEAARKVALSIQKQMDELLTEKGL